jgi:hypothetical protein
MQPACKSGMHYIFPVELLKKKGKEAGVGSSSGPEAQKKEALTQSDSEGGGGDTTIGVQEKNVVDLPTASREIHVDR